MEFRILGTIEAVESGITLSLKGPRLRLLLAVLLAHAGERVSTDFLVNAFWGDTPPDNARALLQVRVSELRHALSLDPQKPFSGLVTHSSGYQITVNYPDALDSWAFEQLVDQGQNFLTRSEFLDAYRTLKQALSLWRGSPFQEFENQPFAETQSAHLTALYLQAMEDRLAAALAIGRHNEVAALARTLVTKYPLREGIWFQLMLAQYRGGQQGEALQSYDMVRDQLSEQLGIDPGKELQQLHLRILRQDPSLVLEPRASAIEPPPARNNLPAPVTSFIGREWELIEVREMITEHRLVTLVGGGGVGKSRLALELAQSVLEDFDDGVWFVELPRLGQPRITAQTLAKTLELSEHPVVALEDVIEERLQREKTLLVLDGCEYVIDDVSPLVYRLLRACPNVSILATSQERLGIAGESLRTLAGLDVPEVNVPRDIPALMQSGAVKLLVERASAVQPGFRLDERNSRSIIQICRRLDGLPLAIELAAALVNSLDVHLIAQRLENRFDLLNRPTPGPLARHQTLRAVADWSYGLLDTVEQQLFDSLAIFVGGFSLDAAEALIDSDEQLASPVAVTLSRLVDKSLLISEDRLQSGRRYRMLDSLRLFGLERLEANHRLERLQVLHASYYLTVAEAAAPALRGREQEIWVDRLSQDHDNLRSALETSIQTGDYETSARIAGSLYPFWDLHGHYAEGRQWIARILQPGQEMSNEARTRVLLGEATLAVIQGDPQTTVSACMEAVGLARGTGDRASLAHALQYLGLCAMFQNELDEADSLLGQSLENAIAAKNSWLQSWAYIFMLTVALSRGQYELAGSLALQCLSAAGQEQDPECAGWAALALGASEWHSGSQERAVSHLSEGFQIFQGLGGLWGLSLAVFMASEVAGARGNIQQQVVLMAAAEQLRTSIGVAALPFLTDWLDQASPAARAVLGDEEYARKWQEGDQLPLTMVVALAQSELDTPFISKLPARKVF